MHINLSTMAILCFMLSAINKKYKVYPSETLSGYVPVVVENIPLTYQQLDPVRKQLLWLRLNPLYHSGPNVVTSPKPTMVWKFSYGCPHITAMQ
jgi:hypothetical protein